MNIDELLKCLNCGFCVKGCPQYQKYKIETKSPRGKIRTIEYCYENNKDIDYNEFNACEGCDKCQSVCPANINFKTYFNKTNLKEIFDNVKN